MPSEMDYQCVLIVSSADKAASFISEVLPKNDFMPVLTASSASEAKRMLIESSADIVIINTPLSDDSGLHLAVDTAAKGAGVLVIVKPEMYEQVSYKMERYGILTLTKSLNKQTLYQTVKLLSVTAGRMKRLEESTARLERRLKEMKLINKAKGLLIECAGMSEEEAHRYIEKTAMDNCIKKTEAASIVIEKYEY